MNKLVVGALVIGGCLMAQANTWYAKPNAVGGEACDDPQTAGTVKEAIGKAAAEDTVVLLSGTYDRSGEAQLSVTKKITICSQTGNPADVELVGGFTNVPNRCFYVNAAGARLEGLTIRNFGFAGNGGAVYLNTAATVMNCVFRGNSAGSFYSKTQGDGGAVYVNTQAEAGLFGCSFVTNFCFGSGGAVYFYDKGGAADCVFQDNWNKHTAHCSGGAIRTSSSNWTFSNCVFTANRCYSGGNFSEYGALGNGAKSYRCFYTNNYATTYGGSVQGGTHTECVFADHTSASRVLYGGTYVRCRITGNSIPICNNGTFYNCLITGGNSCANGSFTGCSLYNCSIVNNKFTGSGWNWSLFPVGKPIVNCIYWDDPAYNPSPAREFPIYQDAIYGGKPCMTNCIFQAIDAKWLDASNIKARKEDMHFVGTGDDPYALEFVSMAVDAGTTYPGMTDEGDVRSVDIRRDVRIWGKAPDIGCYEYNEVYDPNKISAAWVEAIPDQVFTGPALTPKPLVTNPETDEVLEIGKDYTVAYADNRQAGLATATVTGCGAYSGEAKVCFHVIRGRIGFWVSSTATGEETGYSRAEASTFETVFAKAIDGDTITVIDATYDRAGKECITIAKDVEIRSESGNPENCALVGGGREAPGRAMVVSGNGVTIAGMTFRNFAMPTAGGGAIRVSGSGCVISNCTFEANECGKVDVNATTASSHGGAIMGLPWIVDCRFIGNCAHGSGGAVYFTSSSTPIGVLRDSFFAFNYVSNKVTRTYGGAVCAASAAGVCSITNCIFATNTAYQISEWGCQGAIGGALNTYGCLFDGNRGVTSGGTLSGGLHVQGVFVNASRPIENGTFIRCAFSNNTDLVASTAGSYRNCLFVKNNGSAMLRASTVHNCMIVRNTITGGWNSGLVGGAAKVVNTIFEGNSMGSGAICNWLNGSPSGGVPVISNSVIQGYVYQTWTNNVTTDHSGIKYVGKGEHPWALRRTSFGVDAGLMLAWMTNNPPSSVDFKGDPRVAGRAPDLGCYEYCPKTGFTIIVK